jgi:hypothetical protein
MLITLCILKLNSDHTQGVNMQKSGLSSPILSSRFMIPCLPGRFEIGRCTGDASMLWIRWWQPGRCSCMSSSFSHSCPPWGRWKGLANSFRYWDSPLICDLGHCISPPPPPFNLYFCCIIQNINLKTSALRRWFEVKYGVRSPKIIWASVYSCTHWLRPQSSPLPPAFGHSESGQIHSVLLLYMLST